MSDCFVLYLLLICMKKKKSGAGKFTNNRMDFTGLCSQDLVINIGIYKLKRKRSTT